MVISRRRSLPCFWLWLWLCFWPSAAGATPEPDASFLTDRPLLWPVHRPSLWRHTNGISIWGYSEGLLTYTAQDVVLDGALSRRAYFLATHGHPGGIELLPTRIALDHMTVGPGKNVIFDAVCWAGTRGEGGTPSLAELQQGRFGVAAVGPNGKLTFSDPILHEGRPTVFYQVRDRAGGLLPRHEAFTTVGGRTGRAYRLRNAAESLLNRNRHGVRYMYGETPRVGRGAAERGARAMGLTQFARQGRGLVPFSGGMTLGLGVAALALHAYEDGVLPTAIGGAVGLTGWTVGTRAIVWGVARAGLARTSSWLAKRAIPIVGQALLVVDIAALLVSLGTGYGEWRWTDVWKYYAGTLDAPTYVAGPPPPSDQPFYYP